MTLGQKIKSYRKDHGLSMQAFADLSGLSKAYIAFLEKGINPSSGRAISPTLETFIKLARAMRMSVDTLMNSLDKNQPVTVNQSAVGTSLPPSLIQKDEKQIAADLESLLKALDDTASNSGDDDDKEDRELLKASLKQAMTLSRRIAKKKFTPRRYQSARG